MSLGIGLGIGLPNVTGGRVLRLGPELITGTDSDMSGPNNWSTTNLATLDINTTVADKMYMLGSGSGDWARLLGTLTMGTKYRISLKARLNAGGPTTIRMGNIGDTPANYIEFTPTGAEATFGGDIVSSNATLFIGTIGGFAGIAFEIDDVSAREVL